MLAGSILSAMARVGDLSAPRSGLPASSIGRVPFETDRGGVVDPGIPAANDMPFTLPFYVADAVFDPVRPNLWASDGFGRAVVRVNLTNGLAEKRWNFPFSPGSLAVTPRGDFLYVAMPGPKPDNARVTNGYIAEFDLRNDVLRRVFEINVEPRDIAADDNGLIFVTGPVFLQSHRVSDGAMLDRTTGSTVWGLCISPAGRRIYVTSFADSAFLVPGRIDYDPLGQFGETGQSPWFLPEVAGAGYRVFLLPGGTRLLGGNGGVFTNQPGHPDDLRVGVSIGPVLDCAELPGVGEVLVAGGASSGYYRADTMDLVRRIRTGRPMQYAGAYADRHFLAGAWDGTTIISPRIHPGTNSNANLPPRMRWLKLSPERVFAEGETVTLEAEADDPDGGISRMGFYHAGQSANPEFDDEYPFTWQMRSVQPGVHEVVATAWDDMETMSPPVTNLFRVTSRPTVVWVAPGHPAVLDRGSDYTLEVSAADADGTVSRVDFYDTGSMETWIGSATNAPWRLSLTNLTHRRSFKAVATDNDGATASSGDRWVQLAGPRGDDFYRPFELQGETTVFRAANTNAGSQLFERGIINTPNRSLWWTWTAPSTGTYLVDTFSSDFDTSLGVYADSPDVATLAALGVNNDSLPHAPASAVKFGAIGGRTYRIAVDGSDRSGNVVLSLRLDSPSPGAPSREPGTNDNFRQRIVMTGDRWEADTSNLLATSELYEPLHYRLLAGPSLWWEWTAPTDGLVEITTAGSAIDTVLAVYSPQTTPPSLSSLRRIAANDDDPAGGLTSSGVRFMARQGDIYLVAVTGYNGLAGTVRLLTRLDTASAGVPANDAFADAVTLEGSSGFVKGHTYGATVENGESVFNGQLKATVWYRWQSPVTSAVYTRLVSTGPDAPSYQIISGNTPAGAVRVQSGAGNGQVRGFFATRGVTYSVAVGRSGNNDTTFTLAWSVPEPVSPPTAALSFTSAGNAEIGYQGHLPTIAIIMSSPDLKIWEPVATNNFLGRQMFPLPPWNESQKFYRLVFP